MVRGSEDWCHPFENEHRGSVSDRGGRGEGAEKSRSGRCRTARRRLGLGGRGRRGRVASAQPFLSSADAAVRTKLSGVVARASVAGFVTAVRAADVAGCVAVR